MSAPSAQRRRLTRSADFDAVYRRGRSRSSRHLVVYVFEREGAVGDGSPRVGVTVSRRVGSAIVRSRLKRQLREAVAAIGAGSGRHDLVVVARPGLGEAVEQHGFDWLIDELRPLLAIEGGEG